MDKTHTHVQKKKKKKTTQTPSRIDPDKVTIKFLSNYLESNHTSEWDALKRWARTYWKCPRSQALAKEPQLSKYAKGSGLCCSKARDEVSANEPTPQCIKAITR